MWDKIKVVLAVLLFAGSVALAFYFGSRAGSAEADSIRSGFKSLNDELAASKGEVARLGQLLDDERGRIDAERAELERDREANNRERIRLAGERTNLDRARADLERERISLSGEREAYTVASGLIDDCLGILGWDGAESQPP